MMKAKTTALLCSIIVMAGLFGGCRNENDNRTQAQSSIPQESSMLPEDPDPEPAEGPDEAAEKTPVNVIAMVGPTGMGLVGMMSGETPSTVNEYQFQLAGSPDEVAPKVITGEVDIAAVPANLGAVLSQRTEGEVSMLGVNTLGVLYLLTRGEEVATVEDLRGKTIYATGQGATPEYTLNYILARNGLELGVDIKVEYLSEHAELATLILAGDAPIAMLPEPFVTTVTTKDEDVKIALDLTREWEAVSGGEKLPTGSILVRNEFLEANPQAVEAFLAEYEASVNFVNSDPEGAADLIGKYEIASAEVARLAIPRCNIVLVRGNDMKAMLETYYGILLDANPQSVGGSLPDEGFYYLGE